ncbi:hypothetical protein CspHIS471_0411010 [Cutaneotrichosporon sp. HIS471]|nr:hypothetical protein CspHIS471_0411010 [Cutaneotrichosporon sp. HIS471]
MNASTTSMDIDSPWMFANSAKYSTPAHSTPALALARAGGPEGTTYLYQLDDAPAAAPGGGFEAGGGTDGTYLPPTSVATYPTPPSSLSGSYRVPARPPPEQLYPLTPSSVASNLVSNLYRPNACSLTRSASSASAKSNASSTSSTSSDDAARCGPVLPLIHAVFPATASSVSAASHMLEIVTPPTHVLHGFIADEPTLGRLVFVHLPPTHASAPARPEVLAPHFFNVLHSDGPTYSDAPAPPTGPVALDIRESLTALLDLADEIEGTQLVLILDKDEREPAPLAELMHALMYVGGTPVRPGAPVGEWEWDARRWALVSIEL